MRDQHSTALVGKRIYYRYSEVETYEHIYVEGLKALGIPQVING